MPELSQNFIKGRMNKDLDERLVANGEYRDALNIEVSTSEGANVGAMQTTMGNTQVGTGFGTCVASITDEKNDDIYWLVAGSSTDGKDAILKYHLDPSTNTYVVTPVLVDVWSKTYSMLIDSHGTHDHWHIGNLGNNSINITSIRKGMLVTGTFTNNSGGTVSVMGTNIANGGTYTLLESHGVIVNKIENDYPSNAGWRIYLTSTQGSTIYTLFPSKAGDSVTFSSKTRSGAGAFSWEEDRVLNFDSSRLITGINIIDDLMFWTDNYSEPKKINLTKCIKGTLDINTHSSFIVEDVDGNNYTIPSSLIQNGAWGTSSSSQGWHPIRKDHITVIKKSPLIAPKLEMDDTEGIRGIIYTTITTNFHDATLVDNLSIGSIKVFSTWNPNPDWRQGDIVLATNDTTAQNIFQDSQSLVRLKVISTTPLQPTAANPLTQVELEIIAITSTMLTSSDEDWKFVLERSAPLFEFKFPRFAYRYKYQDGEYSAFSPFSRVAFMPGVFDYNPKKGYNLGMTNQLRNLKVKDFVEEDSIRPHGVIAIDILYKESNSPNVYSVKTITTSDEEWDLDGINPNASGVLTRGSIEITSEIIHAAIPTNQLLRPWDNVPRKALAQDISANRLIYGNYLQNFNLKTDNGLNPKFENVLNLDSIIGGASPNSPKPSIKSLRTYQVGLVYRDEFGRETPVFSSKVGNSGAITLKKDRADKENILKVSLGHDPPSFADSFKFFIKETSNEYYNLAMDRWYDAEDGNVWLSFPSAERSKIDEETYLILKKQHDTDIFVGEEARYKVIAIDNEVPEYVKKRKKPYGETGNNNDRDVFGTAGGGYPDKNVKFVYVNKELWDSTSMKTQEDDDHTKYVRFKTATRRSKWYEVQNISGLEVNNMGEDDTIMIETIESFGKDMDFTTHGSGGIGTGLWTDRIGSGNSNLPGRSDETLTIELAREIEEVKPEHRGRFFVKIYRDGVLQKHIMNSSKQDAAWVSVFSEPIYHIDNDSYLVPPSWKYETPEGTGGSSWWSANVWSIALVDLEKQTKNWWANFGSHWFLDNSRTRNNRGVWATGSNTYYGATIGDVDGMDGQPHRGYYGKTAGGITHNDKKMHLAFSGIYQPGTVPGPAPTTTVKNHGKKDPPLLDVGVNANLDEKTWVDYITTPGTVFKWSKDPGYFDNSNPPVRKDTMYVVEKAVFYKSGCEVNDNKDIYDELTNYDFNHSREYREAGNKRIRWEITVGQWSGEGERPTTTNPGLGIGDNTNGLSPQEYNPIRNTYDYSSGSLVTIPKANHHDNPHAIEILEIEEDLEGDFSSTNPAIWETEPKEDIGLDLYYEASDANPIDLNAKTNEIYVPVGSYLTLPKQPVQGGSDNRTWTTSNYTYFDATTLKTTAFNDDTITINDQPVSTDSAGVTGELQDGDVITFTKPSGGMVTGKVKSYATVAGTSGYSTVKLYPDLHNRTYFLDWFNCYSFGNGVESNRIRDDFNAVTIDKGPRVSTVLAEPYEEERKKNGLIYSGIYNSTGGVNNLNQFIMAEKITKDLSPRFGSIQKLHARDTDLVTLCEDKIVRCLANKDAVFNADGNTQLTATSKVLGQTIPYAGEYGISTNPESFASRSFQAYFSDRVRGVVMRLSKDGLTAVSEHGMKDWFSDNLKGAGTIVGSYDDKKSLYNITLKDKVTEAVVIKTDTTPISFVNTNPIGYFIPTSNPISSISTIKYTQTDDDNNYTTGGGSLSLVTQIAIPTTGYYENRSTELQALIDALDECPNGTIYLHYQVQAGLPVGEGEIGSTYTDTGAPIITYTVNSYTFNDNGAYILDVDYHSGTYAQLDFVYFWWSSEDCDTDDNGDDGDFVERTLSFAEKTNGWVSFKSWIQESGLSMNGKFYTFSGGNLYEHEKNELRNNFYGTQYTSTVDVLLNEQPGSVKSFQTLKYSGTQAKITKNTLTGVDSDGYNQFDNEYYNNIGKTGWYASSIETDLQSGKDLEFRPKEGKWFTAMQGVSTYFTSAQDNNVDENEFSVQGIGYTASVHCPECGGDPPDPIRDKFNLTIKDDPTDH